MGVMSLLGYIRKEEHDAVLSKTYLQAYMEGYSVAKAELILSKLTPNDIRKACGLDPVDEYKKPIFTNGRKPESDLR